MLQVIPSRSISFISANIYEKYVLSKENCNGRHDDKMCFLNNCRYHIILIGDIKELLKNSMHSVSTTNTWSVCIHFSSTDSVAKMLSRVDKSLIMCRGLYISTTKTEAWTESPASQNRDSLGKSTEKYLLIPFQETKSMQTGASVHADRAEQVTNTICWN